MMDLAALCTDPFVLSCTVLCLLLHLALRSLHASSSTTSGRRRRLPPGPRGLPILGALPLVGPAPHAGLAALAKKYGPIMYLKMGTCGVVVASSPSAARTFLKALDARYANRPDVASAADITYARQNMVFADYGPRWKLMRKLASVHLLGARALAGWAAVRRDEARRMMRGVAGAAREGRHVVVPEVLVCALANIVGQITVSKRVFDAQGDESNSYKDMIVSLLTGAGLFNISDFVPALARLDLQGVQAKLRRIHHQFDALITQLLEEHAATAADRARQGRQDFVDRLRASMQEGEEEEGETITEVNIKGLIFDMFTAGTDTSSIIVEWALAELLQNPSVMARLQAELDRVVGRARLLEESDLPHLPYLHAVCKEAMRLHPSTPLSLPHFAFDACDIDDPDSDSGNQYHVPANTRLLINIWAIGRDPGAWGESPLEFRPERFLPGGEAAGVDPVSANCFELIPFGAGRRVCAGKLAGMVFVQYFLGALVHAFEWRLPDGQEKLDMRETFGLALPKAVPLRAVVAPRLAPEAYDAAA